MARTATVKTAFLSGTELASLQGKALVHRLTDGTLVRCEATTETSGGYVMARIVEGTYKHRTVRLDSTTRLSATPLGALSPCGKPSDTPESREVRSARIRLQQARHEADMRRDDVPAWVREHDTATVARLQAELAGLLAASYASAAA